METVNRTLTGMKGVISSGSGEQAVHAWETIEFRAEGVYLHHQDLYETVTFFPIYTIRQVRLHDAAKEREGPNRSGEPSWSERKVLGKGEGCSSPQLNQ